MTNKEKKFGEEALEKLKNLDRWDIEMAHSNADDILCELLTKLGFKEVVETFKKIEKWYA